MSGGFKYIPALDGVRAVAVAIVVVSHAGLGDVVPGGYGVTLFFFLSGYLITSILREEWQRTDGFSIRDFYVKRTLRIFPPLYVTLGFVTLAYLAGVMPGKLDALPALLDAFFLSNYRTYFDLGTGFPIPLWSLAVEEHFYIVFSVLFLAIVPLGRTRFLQLVVALCGLALVVRTIALGAGEDPGQIYYMTHTRYDSILFGSALALWSNPSLDKIYWKPSHLAFAVAIAVTLSTFVIRDEYFRQTLRYSIQGAAMLVIFSYIMTRDVKNPVVRMLSWDGSIWIGKISYTLYLIHFPILLFFEQFDELGQIQKAGAAIAASLVFSEAMRRTVEKPILAKRRALLTKAASNPDSVRSSLPTRPSGF